MSKPLVSKPRADKIYTPQERLRAMAKLLDIAEKLGDSRTTDAVRLEIAARMRGLAEEMER